MSNLHQITQLCINHTHPKSAILHFNHVIIVGILFRIFSGYLVTWSGSHCADGRLSCGVVVGGGVGIAQVVSYRYGIHFTFRFVNAVVIDRCVETATEANTILRWLRPKVAESDTGAPRYTLGMCVWVCMCK